MSDIAGLVAECRRVATAMAGGRRAFGNVDLIALLNRAADEIEQVPRAPIVSTDQSAGAIEFEGEVAVIRSSATVACLIGAAYNKLRYRDAVIARDFVSKTVPVLENVFRVANPGKADYRSVGYAASDGTMMVDGQVLAGVTLTRRFPMTGIPSKQLAETLFFAGDDLRDCEFRCRVRKP